MHGSFVVPRATFRNPGPTKEDIARVEMQLAKQASEICQKHYPGHPWNIEADINGGVLKIQLQPYMGPMNWYVIHITSCKNLFVFEAFIKRFCGEILERYNVPRCGYDGEMWRAVSASIPAHRKFHGFFPN